MKISHHAIDHPRIVLVVTVLVLLMAGFVALNTPVQRSPAITKAVVLVAIPYPDAQPSETENEIARKLEDALSELQGVDFKASTNLRGTSVTQIVFLDGVKPKDARREVKDLVDRIRNELPLGREVQPVVTDIDFDNYPLMLVNITGPPGFDQRALKEIAEDVQVALEQVDGVSNTQLFGGHEREIHVDVQPDLMMQYGLSLAQMRQALADFHAEVPAGAFNTGQVDRTVRNETKFRGVEDIREAIVSSEGGRVVRVSDVANVVDARRRFKNLAQVDGEVCASIIVNKEANINTLGAARAIKAKVQELRQQHPDLRFSTTRDTSEEISIMFRVLGSSAAFGAMLVLVILAWSMGLRLSLLVLIAIPFSTAVAITFLYWAGIAISNMVVFSFILVLGMVVDGAIIVAENIYRHIERGEHPETAAKVGIDEVGLPVIAADMTTIAAFLPMIMVPGIMGDFMGVMPKVVAVALFGSVLVDHLVIPTCAARWFRQRTPRGDESASFAAISAMGPALAGGGRAVPPAAEAEVLNVRVRPNIGPLTKLYAVVLRAALANRWFVMAWAGLAVWGAVILVQRVGFEFFPSSDRGQFIVRYELPLGYSIEQTLSAAQVIIEPLKKWEQAGLLRHYVTAVGASEGLANRLENDPATGPEFGQIMVELLSPLDRDIHEQEVIAQLRRDIRPLPGMRVTIEEVKDGPPAGPDVSVRLTGDDLEQLGRLGENMAAELARIRGTVDATTDYRPNNPELVIEPRPEIVGLFGLTEMQIARAIQIAIAGDNTIQITLDDEDVDIRLQLAPEYQRHPDDIKRLMIPSAGGQKATIGQLAELRRDVGVYSINRYEDRRAVVARCNVVEPILPDDVFDELRSEVVPALGFVPAVDSLPSLWKELLDDHVRPLLGLEPAKNSAKLFVGTPLTPSEGVLAEFVGENEERDKNFRYLTNSMALGALLIYAILVMQFNSLRQGIVVMVTVPLSFIGVVVGLWACGFAFSLASFIGLVSLSGVVVNDAIVLIDFTNQARRRGLPVREALIEAGVNRLRPVLLTTVTTIGGLLPLLLNISGGAEFWQPLTGAIVFGLVSATMLTLVVIPVCYSLAYSFARPR